MGLETGRSRRSKNSIKSSSTVLCDPVACIEDWKQQIKVKHNIPANQQRLTFTSQVLNKETLILANFNASRQWQIVVDASADDLCKHFQSWRAHLYSKVTYAELFCSMVLTEEDDCVFPLQSKTAEELRQIGVPCNVFYLTFDKWIPSWKGGISEPVAVEGHPETINLQVDDQLQQDTFCIELYGCLDGLSLPMPLRYVMNGEELIAKLLMVEQTANYRAEQKIRYQLSAPTSKVLDSSEKAPEEEKHLSELKSWNLYFKDYIVHFEKKCEFTAIISQDHRQLRCIVLPVITIPLSVDKVNKEHLIYKLIFDRSKEPSSEVLTLPSTSQSPSTVLSSSDKVCVPSSVEKNDGKVTKKRKKRKPRKSAKRKINSTEHQNGEQREVDSQDKAFEELSHVHTKAPHMPCESHHSTLNLKSPSFMAGYSGVDEIEVSSGQCSIHQGSLHIQKAEHKSFSQQSKPPVSLAEVKCGDSGLASSVDLVGADFEHTKELVGADSESIKQDLNQFSTNKWIHSNGTYREIASLVSSNDNSSCCADASVSVIRKEEKPEEGQEICYCKGDCHTSHCPKQTNVSYESGQDAYVGLGSVKRVPTFAMKDGTHTCNTYSTAFSDNLSCNMCSIAFSDNLSDRRLIDEPKDISLVSSDLSSNQQVDNVPSTSSASAHNAVQRGAKFSEMGKKMDVASQHDKGSRKWFSTLLGNTDQFGISNLEVEKEESRGHVTKLSQGIHWNHRSPESQDLHFKRSSNQEAFKSFCNRPSFSHWKHPKNDLQTSQTWPRTVYPKQENLPLVDGGSVSRINQVENFLSWDQVPSARCSFRKEPNPQPGPGQFIERENKFPLVPSSTLGGYLCNSHDRINERTGRFGEALLQHERGSKTNEISLQQERDCVVDEAKKRFTSSKVVSSLDRTLHQSHVNSRLTQPIARGSRMEGGSDSEPLKSCLEKPPPTSPTPNRSLHLSCLNWSNTDAENICKNNQERSSQFEPGQGLLQKGDCEALDVSSGTVIATASAADITMSRPDHASCDSEKDLLEITTMDYAGGTTSNKEIKILLGSILDAISYACESYTAYEQVASASGFPLCEFEKVAKAVSPTFKATQATLHPWSFTGCCCVRSMAESCRSANLQNLADVRLSSLWQWYEEPSCFGLEVKLVDWHVNSRKDGVGNQYQGFFVPYLSGMQLFRKTGLSEHQDAGSAQLKMKDAFDCSFLNQPIFSILLPKPKLEDDTKILCCPELELEDPNSSRRDNRESTNLDCHKSIFEKVKQCECNAKLLYEFFEGEKPPQRKPFSDRIQQLVMGHVAPESSNFGDGQVLDNVKIGELHPASWFAVAWYPIYRIPDRAFRSAFLTYHSLSCLRLDSSASNDSLSNSLDSFTAPVVGLMSYSAQAEDWFTVGPQYTVKEFPNATGDLNPSHVLKQYVTRLEATAAAIANSSNSTSKHMDYSFFLSRRR